ncbi:replication protein C, IncQ-type [Variovorax saccharolyticus]|uniref:replication protein C, IncQ-type n=1 Tax=Variovorax saccharolyticus TaxID=3053516 RepID=UPI00336A3B22
MVDKTWFETGGPAVALPPIAKFDKTAILILGLFRSLDPHSEPPTDRVEFSRTFDEGDVEVTLSCRSLLGASDVRVLQGLVAIATDRYRSLAADRLYGRTNDVSGETRVRVKCSLRRLAMVAGLGSPGAGPTNRTIRQSLGRLCDVTVTWRSEGGTSGYTKTEPFIRNGGSAVGHGSVNVTFHSRLEAAILASRKGEHYLKVRMDEARGLGDCARLLHHRLAHMNEGERTGHGRDKLEAYLWGESPSRSADRNRVRKLVGAIKELEGAGWAFEKDEASSIIYITRPRSLAVVASTPSKAAGNSDQSSKDKTRGVRSFRRGRS